MKSYIKSGIFWLIIIAMIFLMVGYGELRTQSIIPELKYNTVSSASSCDKWSLEYQYYYRDNDGRGVHYYHMKYDGVYKAGVYTIDVGIPSVGTSEISSMKVTPLGGTSFKYECAYKCQAPTISYGNISITDDGVARIDVNISAGGEEYNFNQNIDMQTTQVYAYNGTSWFDISSQLDPTLTEQQTTTLKWNVADGESGKVKIKVANTCGYILGWEESESILYKHVEIIEDTNDIEDTAIVIKKDKTLFGYIRSLIEWFKNWI